MGLCGGNPQKERYKLATSKKIERTLDRLQVSEKEVMKFYKIYEKIDNDNSGFINVDEFFEHFGLEYSSFAERAFAVMDVERTGEGSGRLDFCEFFIGLYNYCTMSHDHLVKFAFDLFDIDGGGEIGKAELMELVRMVYGKKEVEGTVMKLLKADKDKNGQVSILEFREMERTSRSLLFPAFDLQRKMAEKIMGKAYWDKATKRRKLAIGDTQDVIELHYATYHKKKLNRKEVNDNASVIREGVLKVDSDVRAEPTGGTGRGAALVREIKKGEQVTIYEERDVEGNLWYLINGKEGEWVMANDIKVDHSLGKTEARVAKIEASMADANAEKAKEEGDKEKEATENKRFYKEAIDEGTGRKYWYHTGTMATTWEKPYGL